MTSAVTGSVRSLLRLEGLCILVAGLFAYAEFGGGWGIFALFILAPDLSFAGYLAGPAVGAVVYNLAHSLVGPLALLVVGVYYHEPMLIMAGLIWVAHIGLDRVLGYGLKYPGGFHLTHLGVIGRGRTDA